MLGEIVTVTVDRPLGSVHPRHPDIFYTVNYGFVAGFMAPDGEAQDAYILGIDEAIQTFTGKVIAVIRRLDDVEEKWVVAPAGKVYSKQEIQQAVYFQERFFKTEIHTNS